MYSETIIQALKSGQIGVIPTDTLYGLVASTHHPAAVERVYQLREREPGKPLIVLVGGPNQLPSLQVSVTPRHRELIDTHWPGPVSIVFPCLPEAPEYLHRGTATLAIRLPAHPELRRLLIAAGPIVAPSANLAGQPPALTIPEARAYFGGQTDFHVDTGHLNNPPSMLIAIRDGELVTLRGYASPVRN